MAMDWLILWWMLGGGNQRREVLIETTQERETRLRREAEACAAFWHGVGMVLTSLPVVILIGIAMLYNARSVFEILTGAG
jgi:hypothetical protein